MKKFLKPLGKPFKYLSIYFAFFMAVALLLSAAQYYNGKILEAIYLAIVSLVLQKFADWFSFAAKMERD